MSTIQNSPYDLFATYSTAATDYVGTQTLSSSESSSSTGFMDMLVAENNANAIEDADPSPEADGGSTDTDSDEDSGSSGSTGGSSTSGTTNDNYYRPDVYEADTPSDELSFADMLALMVLQFQSQTIDDTASTTDMMNQLTQMTTMQAMTSMDTSIKEMTATNAMLYNSQLVGKEVTVAYYNENGEFIEETGVVAASGYYDGVPVIFFEGQTTFHTVSSIMAVGVIPQGTTVDPDKDDTTVEPDQDDTTVEPDVSPDSSETNPEAGETTSPDSAGSDADTQSAEFVDYSSMTAEQLLQAAQNALG